MPKRILVLHAQVPFVVGGVELLVKSLINNIHISLPEVEVDLVQLPYSWHPHQTLMDNIAAWRLLDLTEVEGKKVDLVIATKFPSYAIRHPNKVLWLVHQYRQAYDLANTVHGLSSYNKGDRELMLKLTRLDQQYIKECKGIYSISSTISARLKMYNQIEAAPLLPPPILADKIEPGVSKGYFICISRLNPFKRIDLIITALAKAPNVRLKIIGRGDEFANLQALIVKLKLQARCELLGFVEDARLIEELRHAVGLIYTPIDEDYGYAAVEGLLAKKPVITCTDSGEVAAMVNQYQCGRVVAPTPRDLAKAMEELNKLDATMLTDLTQTGYHFAKSVNWDTVINQLVKQYL